MKRKLRKGGNVGNTHKRETETEQAGPNPGVSSSYKDIQKERSENIIVEKNSCRNVSALCPEDK